MNEYTDGLHKGTSTSGAFNNDWIMRIGINAAQRLLYAILMRLIPNEFLSSEALTGVNSVFTLPWDFGAIVEFRDDKGLKVFPADSRAVPATSGTGSDRVYYTKGSTFVLTKSGVTDDYTLWYWSKPRDLDQGSLTYSSPTTTLASSAKAIADYYNGMIFEDVTNPLISTITDYTAARVVTITGTPTTLDYYGIVSELPEPFHHLITPRAILECKALHPATQEKPTQASYANWMEQVVEALRAYAGSRFDIPPEDIWCDFDVGPTGPGVNIPGQGYLI
ncbi:MAG: hypothetical protein V3W44_04815 [Dehalococcoidales bacterium]